LKSLPSADQQPTAQAPPPAAAPDSEHAAQNQPSAPDPTLVLEINPTWGLQKMFQHYRAALSALYDGPAPSKPTIARFRQANLAVEQRLRAKLSSRMREIDAIYQRAEVEP
jgi:hypothetical protein